MMTKMLLWVGMIAPWFSLFFMKRQDIKRFMPATLLAMLVMPLISEAAFYYNWWTIDQYLFPWGSITMLSILFGPFFIGTLWIFRLTYHKWWLFFLVNLVVDAGFTFVLNPWFLDGWLYSFHQLNYFGAFLIMFGTAIPIYFYQRWQDEVIVGASGRGKSLELMVNNPFRLKEKGKS